MQIVRDLSDEQLTELLLESDRLYVRRAFGSLAEIAGEAADQPHTFWRNQNAAIWARIRAAEKYSARATMTFASAVALMLMTALLMRPGSRDAVVRPQPDPDQELMIAVERTVGSDVPAALEPAALLSNEIIKGTRRQTSHREGAHQ
ncbi:MAG: hypothetical protein ACRD2U_12745 [Terriglobales bacterium]